MKIRNGFVSNSSSSSFILNYNKSNVLTDPKDIVKYLRDYPDNPVIFRNYIAGEGEDIFELDEEQKDLIRKFSDIFISRNSGTTSADIFVYEDKEKDKGSFQETVVPKITCYPEGELMCDSLEYHNFEEDVDKSDLKEVDLPKDYWTRKDDPEIKALLKESEAYYDELRKRAKKIQTEKEEVQLKKAKEDYVKYTSFKPEDVEAEKVWIWNNGTSSEYNSSDTFAERYLTDEYNDYDRSKFLLSRKGKVARPYLIAYDEIITDKNEIINYLKNNDGKNYLAWINMVYNYIADREVMNVDYYEVGQQELEVLDKKKFADSNREAVLYTNASIMSVTEDVANITSKHVQAEYGKPCVIDAGNNLPGFKKNIVKSEAY